MIIAHTYINEKKIISCNYNQVTRILYFILEEETKVNITDISESDAMFYIRNIDNGNNY